MTRSPIRLGTLLLIGLLGVGLYAALREGVVSLLAHGVGDTVQRWAEDPDMIDPGGWDRARDFAELALQWGPHDAGMLQTAGSLYWWGAWSRSDSEEVSAELLDRSLALYRRSIRQRPAWPDGWLSLARAKHWRDHWDDETQHAYTMAWRTGSWRQQVIFAIAELGFEARWHLSPENRRIFHTALERASLRDARRLRELARSKRATFLLCLTLHDDPATRDYCATQGYRLDE